MRIKADAVEPKKSENNHWGSFASDSYDWIWSGEWEGNGELQCKGILMRSISKNESGKEKYRTAILCRHESSGEMDLIPGEFSDDIQKGIESANRDVNEFLSAQIKERLAG